MVDSHGACGVLVRATQFGSMIHAALAIYFEGLVWLVS